MTDKDQHRLIIIALIAAAHRLDALTALTDPGASTADLRADAEATLHGAPCAIAGAWVITGPRRPLR